MAEPPVVNSSPLIVLSRAGLLDLLRLAGERVLVPTVVADEIAVYGTEEAKDRGLTYRARPLVERVRRAGLFLSERLVQDSLRLVGE